MVSNAGAAGVLFDKPVAGFEGMTDTQAGALKQQIHTEILGTENANSIAVANGDL